MYAYGTLLSLIYLCSLRGTRGTSEVTETAKTNVTFDLRKLKEHGNTQEETAKNLVGHTTFTTGDNQVVDKVVYDGHELWTAATDSGKVLKTVTVLQKDKLVQLVHLTLQAAQTGETAQVENVYFKKAKNTFTKFDTNPDTTYTSEKTKLVENKADYVDNWFPLDLQKKELHAGLARDQLSLFDGVWKRHVLVTSGRPYVVRDGTDVWTAANEETLTDLEVWDFGEDNKLLQLTLKGAASKYYHKTAQTQWTAFANKEEFDTKAANLKSRFFETTLEYDVAVNPNLKQFWVQRTFKGHNLNVLTVTPTRTFFVNKLKYGNNEFWTSNDKKTRVLTLRLTLLNYEVKLVHLTLSQPSDKLFPDRQVKYFYKDDSTKTFKELTSKADFRNHERRVEGSVDKTAVFTYRDNWVQEGAKWDLNNYNADEFTVADDTEFEKGKERHGAVFETLTPKESGAFVKLSFDGLDLWPAPNRDQNATKPVVKSVYLVKKNGLLQLLHLTATKHETPNNVSLYLKKNGEVFNSVPKDEFDKYKVLMLEKDYLADKVVHVDLNDETLNPKFFTVTKDFLDGVHKKVVTVDAVQVTQLTNYNNEVWTQPTNSKDTFVTKFELHSVGDKKLLKVHLTARTPNVVNHEFFEKPDLHAEWARLETGKFNQKLVAFKNADAWTPLDLNLAKAPLAADYHVERTELSGNKSVVTVVPLFGKKVTKVKLGLTVFFETRDNNRAVKAVLHLENYDVKFLELDVWTPGRLDSTHDKKLKYRLDGTTWTAANFDAELTKFKEARSEVAFTYNPNWTFPPVKFDPKTFTDEYFTLTEAADGAVKTTKYEAKAGTTVKHVFVDDANVWPENAQAVEANTKKLVFLEVVTKDAMVQLVHLQNALVATPNTVEDLYFKKDTARYVKLQDLAEFDKLKETLKQEGTYVDDKVKLDLSADVSTNLFTTETTLEDGVEKTVVEVKQGKLFEVKASPPLWKSTNGDYVTKLERYVVDNTQLLVLHVTKKDLTTVKEFFEKPFVPEPQEVRVEPTPTPTATETQPQQPAAPAEAPKPSFSALTNQEKFFEKLNQAKAAVHFTEVTLNLNAYNNTDHFRVEQTTEGTATLYKLYPKKEFRVTTLANGSNNLWTKVEDGQRLVEALVYLHEAKVKFFRAVVWPKDRTDSTNDKHLLFQLEGENYVEKEKGAFDAALKDLTKVPPAPLKTEVVVQPAVKSRFFYKLFLAENVDTALFDVENTTSGDYTFRTLRPKNDTFVNVVEALQSVLWKGVQKDHLWNSAWFALKGNTALADLTVTEDAQQLHKFFHFDHGYWTPLTASEYAKLYAKVPGAPARGTPAPSVPDAPAAVPDQAEAKPGAEPGPVPGAPQPGHENAQLPEGGAGKEADAGPQGPAQPDNQTTNQQQQQQNRAGDKVAEGDGGSQKVAEQVTQPTVTNPVQQEGTSQGPTGEPGTTEDNPQTNPGSGSAPQA